MRRDRLVKPLKYPDGYYLNPVSGIIYYRARIKGKPVKFSTGKKGLRDAKNVVAEKLAELLSDNSSKEILALKGVINPSIEALWNECLQERAPQSSKATMQSYQNSWDYGISKFWSNKTILFVNEKSIKQFEAWYLKENSGRSFFNTRKHFNMLLNFAFREGFLKKKMRLSDLDKVIRTKTKKEKVGRVYSEDEFTKMLNEASNISLNAEVGILIGRYLGARINEVMTLEWSKVNFQKSTISLWSFKNKKWRENPLPLIVKSKLEDLRRLNPKDKFVFPMVSNRNRPMSPQVFDKVWYKILENAQIKDWEKPLAARYHDLRHTCATQTAIDGWPPVVACRYLDMSLKQYEKTYTHIVSKNSEEFVLKSFKGTK